MSNLSLNQRESRLQQLIENLQLLLARPRLTGLKSLNGIRRERAPLVQLLLRQGVRLTILLNGTHGVRAQHLHMDRAISIRQLRLTDRLR